MSSEQTPPIVYKPSTLAQDEKLLLASAAKYDADMRAVRNRERGTPAPRDGMIVRVQLVDTRIKARRRANIDFPGAAPGHRPPIVEVTVRDIPEEQAAELAHRGEPIVSFDGYERLLLDDVRLGEYRGCLRLEIIAAENLSREAEVKAKIAALEAELAGLGNAP